MNIDRKIEAMRERLERSQPCVITFMLKSGEQITADPASAWDVCDNHMFTDDVVAVTANKSEYNGAACTMEALCRSAPNK